jgi:hypothetical protein
MARLSVRELEWWWHDASAAEADARGWLAQVRGLRSRVLYDDGRRPEFRPGGLRDGDPDPLDLHSKHILVRHGGELVGCVRITPLSSPLSCITEQAIGKAEWEKLLLHMDMPPERVVEHARWVVAPGYQDIGTGIYLMGLSFALAYKLGYPSSVATASCQVFEMLAMAGAKRAPDIPVLHSGHYDSDAVVLYGHQSQFAPSMLRQFERMGELIRLGPVYGVRHG